MMDATTLQFAGLLAKFPSFSGLEWAAIEIPFWTMLVGIVGNSACAVVGCYLVLRRMSLLGDAISHSVLGGIAITFLLTGQLGFVMFLGALAVGVLTAFLTQVLHNAGNVPEDSSMGVVFASLFAVGVVIISRYPNTDLDVDCVLYGHIEFVALMMTKRFGIFVPDAFVKLSAVLLLTVGVIMFLWKEFKIASFDPLLATAVGINATAMHYLLMGLTATVTVASLESVGAIVVIAMLIVPAATAHLLTDRLRYMMLIAVGVASASAVAGYLVANHFDTNTAGMMAVMAGVQFALAVFLAPRHGLIAKWLNNFRLGLRIASEDVIATLYRLEERGQRAAAAIGSATRDQIDEAVGGGLVGRICLPLLRRRGQIEVTADGQIQLTGSGRQRGQSLVRSHRLWEAYLNEHFKLPSDHLHDAAHSVEHYIGPELQGRLEAELSQPSTDPHGAKIPPASPEE